MRLLIPEIHNSIENSSRSTEKVISSPEEDDEKMGYDLQYCDNERV